MGYDIYFDQNDPNENGNSSYFRFNIFSMGRYETAMTKLGMVANGKPHPEWPDLPEGIDWDDVETVRYPDDADGKELKPKAVAYEKAHQQILAWTDTDAPGIAAHKFWTNDGWHVTVAELKQAMAAYRSRTPLEISEAVAESGCDADYWRCWIDYLERAQNFGGFRVH